MQAVPKFHSKMDSIMDVLNFDIVYRNTWLGNWKLLIIDLIVNLNLDYLKKTVHNLFTTNTQGGVLQNKFSETFKQNSSKIPNSNFLVKSIVLNKFL